MWEKWLESFSTCALASILRCVTLTLLFSQRNPRGKNKVPTKKNAKYQLLYLNGHPLHVSMGVDLGVRYLNTSGFWSRLHGPALLGFSCAEKCSDLELETCLTAVYSVQLSWDPSLVCFNMYSIRASAIHPVGSDAVNMQLFCSRLDMFGISATQTTYVAGSISCPLTIWTYFQSEIYSINTILQILVHFWNKIFQNPVLPRFFSPESTEKNRPTS